MTRAPLLAALLALAAGCRMTGAGGGVPFENLQRGYSSGLREPGLHVARSEDEWRGLWDRHTANVLPRPTMPAVDWSRDMVLCVALGERPTAGYGVEVRRILQVGERLRVEAFETRPDAGALLPQVLTQPYQMVTTALRDSTFELVLR